VATAGRRTGRRPGRSGSRDAILDAARELFGARGYEGATIRAIAAGAGVDPGLVMHFFGSKEGVFVAAMELPYQPSTVLPGLLAGDPAARGERLARFFVDIWDRPEARSPFLAMIRSATTNEDAATLLREFLEREMLTALAAAIDAPDAELRAALAGAQMVGVATARYIVRVEPLASATADEVVERLAPLLQAIVGP
jgi:AcrR family transcriptional regulator